MWNLLWPMLMVVGANTVYNICAKSTPEKLNSFAALTINYGVAAALSLLLFFVTTGGEKNLIQEIGKTNWAPVVMGLSVVGLELGYILIYRAGWKVSVASLVANLALACILVLVGVLWYKEVLDRPPDPRHRRLRGGHSAHQPLIPVQNTACPQQGT